MLKYRGVPVDSTGSSLASIFLSGQIDTLVKEDRPKISVEYIHIYLIFRISVFFGHDPFKNYLTLEKIRSE